MTTARPSGPPSKPPLRLRSTRAIAPGGGGSAIRLDDADRVAGLAEQLREARRLVRREDDAPPLAQPVLDAVDEPLRPARRQDRLAPAEQVARRQALRGERHPGGLLGVGLPRELEGPRAVEARLPVARREVGDAASPWAGRHLRPARGDAPRPGATGTRRPRRGRLARRGRTGSRRRGGRGRSTERRRATRPRRRRRRRARVPRSPLPGDPVTSPRRRSAPGPGRGARAAASPAGRAVARISSAPPDGSRNSVAGSSDELLDRADAPLVGGVEGAQRVDLVAEELDPDRERRRRREHVDDAAPSRELAPAGDLEDRRVAAVEELRAGGRPARSGSRASGRAAPWAGRTARASPGAAPGRWRRGPSPCPPATPPGPRPGPRSRPAPARCARRQARSAAPARRPAPGRRATRPAPPPRGRRSPRPAPPSRSARRPGRGPATRRGTTWPRAARW